MRKRHHAANIQVHCQRWKKYVSDLLGFCSLSKKTPYELRLIVISPALISKMVGKKTLYFDILARVELARKGYHESTQEQL